MIYPKFLKDSATIGVCAPSDGCSDDISLRKFMNSKERFESIGYKIRATDGCFSSKLGRSADAVSRARELENLLLDDDVFLVIACSGGDFLMEMLSVLRYDIIWNNPKWIQGYSDITSLLFTITTNLDIATVYSSNFKTFSMQKWHESLTNNFEILKGVDVVQHSFDMYESNSLAYNEEFEVYNLDTIVKWDSLYSNSCSFSGRFIGGCLDCLLNIIGTRFDKTKSFLEKYKNDGFIWYFDVFDMSFEAIIRAMWQFNEAGWFKYVNGVVFGRLISNKSCYDVSFSDSLKCIFDGLNVPVLYNADIGHVPPRITVINGAFANIDFSDNQASIKMIFR